MKLPKGKVEKTISGGKEVLRELIQEFKESKFDGYLQLISSGDEGESVGQLVFQKGDPILAEWDGTVEGRKSVLKATGSFDNIILDSVKEDTKIEFHVSVDVSFMLTFFQQAKIDPSSFDVGGIQAKMEEEHLKKEEEERRKKEEESPDDGAVADDPSTDSFVAPPVLSPEVILPHAEPVVAPAIAPLAAAIPLTAGEVPPEQLEVDEVPLLPPPQALVQPPG